MCGITGILGRGDLTIIQKMTNVMSYRGPDAYGHHEDSANRVYLGHRRLSILDISGGVQPMWDNSHSYCIVFNGEIYNFLEIRNELSKLGHSFLTDHSDTEIILEAYKEWGESCVKKFNGMWAFAIFDTNKKKVFISRDRFGKKPLFYSYQNGNFVFASELHLFKEYPYVNIETSSIALKKYFAYGYIPSPLSYYKNIYKLPGGYNAVIDLSKLDSGQALKLEQYWDFQIEPFTSIPKNPEKIWAEELFFLLDAAVKRRMISDVPLGVFLSGGVDSSSIVALASRYVTSGRLKTFSIGFSEESFDETIYSKFVADKFQTDHHIDQLSIDKALDILPEVLARLDEPMGDASILPTYLLSKFTRQYVTVALAGDGGDEIFAGYDPFLALSKAKLYSKLIPNPIHEGIRILMNYIPVSHRNMSLDFKIKRTLRGLSYSDKLWLPVWMGPSSLNDINQLFGGKISLEELYSEAIEKWENCKQDNIVDKTLNFYTKLYLQDNILVKADRASMMNSLEVRAPFMDIDLVNFARKIPWEYKYRKGETKYILKKALEPYLPHNILYRKKKGFGVPIGSWFKEEKLQINNRNLEIFPNSNFAKEKLNSHKRGISDERAFLWNTLMLK